MSTVFVDPDNCELSPNPSMETLRFTLLFPKFTIWKIHFPESKNLAENNQYEKLLQSDFTCVCRQPAAACYVGKTTKVDSMDYAIFVKLEKDSNLQHW